MILYQTTLNQGIVPLNNAQIAFNSLKMIAKLVTNRTPKSSKQKKSYGPCALTSATAIALMNEKKEKEETKDRISGRESGMQKKKCLRQKRKKKLKINRKRGRTKKEGKKERVGKKRKLKMRNTKEMLNSRSIAK